MTSAYLSEEAERTRRFALLDRIVEERRRDGCAKPESDFWKLPQSMQDEIARRLLCE